MGKIWILLPVHNRRAVTQRFVACLAHQSRTDFHLVLIDDGSTDGTAEMVKSQIEPVTVIRGHGNWWWAGSLQQGYEFLQTREELLTQDIVLIANDDTLFDVDFLEKGVLALEEGGPAMVGSLCYGLQSGKLLDRGVNLDWSRFSFRQAETMDQINCLSTRCLFMWAKDFLQTGGFHPRRLPHYYSDYEFTIRANRMGLEMMVCDGLRIELDESTTGNQVPKSDSIKEIFSKKTVINPWPATQFILMTCPKRFILINLARVWWTAVKAAGRILFKNYIGC